MKVENNCLGMIDNTYAIIEKIGKGGYGCVYKVQKMETKEFFAVKVINHYFKNEHHNNKILSKIKNPHIIKFISFEQGNIKLLDEEDFKPYYVFELSDKGSLENYINCGKNGFKELYCKFIFYDILKGFQAIHNKEICHRDIKAENILLSSDKYIIKICDLGFSADSTELQTDYFGTKQYMAPEVIANKNEYNGIKADIFSLGVLLFFLRTSKLAFENAKISNKNIPKTPYDYIKEKSDAFWKICGIDANIYGLTKEFKDLFLKMVSYDPKERPSIEDIINGEWMKEIKDLTDNEYESLRKEVIQEFKEREDIIAFNKEVYGC